jgi:hypothetical protein
MEQEVQPASEKAAAPESVEGIRFAERINRRFKGLDTGSLPIPARQTARSNLLLNNWQNIPEKLNIY